MDARYLRVGLKLTTLVMVKTFVQPGANVDAIQADGMTPPDIAAGMRCYQLEVLRDEEIGVTLILNLHQNKKLNA